MKFYEFITKATNINTIVNLDSIETIEPIGNDSLIIFRSGRQLAVAKDFKSMEHIIGGINV